MNTLPLPHTPPPPLRVGGLTVPVPLAVAPLAGVTNAPFRLLCREMGAGLGWTEMVSAKALVRRHKASREMLALAEGERPAAVQIFGREPSEMADAACLAAEAGADLVDINMGCPVKKILKSGSGVQLMREPHLAERIVEAVARAVAVPVTVKIRLGWSEEEMNYLEVARRAAGAGAAAVTLHPRTRVQGFSGKARWEHVAMLREAVSLPVLGSGDVRSPGDAARLFAETGCDAILIGRAALGRPWIFAETAAHLGFPGAAPDEPGRRDAILRHLLLICRLLPPRLAVANLRKHLAWYSRGMPEGASFRDRLGKLPDPSSLLGEALPFFGFAPEAVPCPAA